MEKIVKNCKNCTISEVWVQITGMPDKLDYTEPHSLFNNLKKSLEKKYQLQCGLRKDHPILLNISTGQHKIAISPPFWNGEIIWTENNYKKILRVGHQFFALHSLFDENNPYMTYKDSFEDTLKKIMEYIEPSKAFDVIELKVRYINKIKLKTKSNGEFDIRDYFNAGFFYNLKSPLAIRYSNFNYEFNSPNNNVIGVNTIIRANNLKEIVSTIETTGVSFLKKQTKLNDEFILKNIQSIKEELKVVFFDVMNDNTKDNIMEVQYA